MDVAFKLFLFSQLMNSSLCGAGVSYSFTVGMNIVITPSPIDGDFPTHPSFGDGPSLNAGQQADESVRLPPPIPVREPQVDSMLFANDGPVLQDRTNLPRFYIQPLSVDAQYVNLLY